MSYVAHSMTNPTLRPAAATKAADLVTAVDMCDSEKCSHGNDQCKHHGNQHHGHSHCHGNHHGHSHGDGHSNHAHNNNVYNAATSNSGSQYYGEDDDRNLQRYKDRIRIYNFNGWLRKHGIRCIPRKYLSNLWFVKDCLGFAGCVFTWILIIFGEIVFVVMILVPFHNSTYSLVQGVFSVLCAFLGFVAHLRAMFTDPGAVPRGNATKENIAKLGLKDGQVVYKCPKCVSIKPERAHHCSVCRRCIRKMDHHCPWVNNCVGENNQKFFVLFTMYICLISVHALYMTIHHFVVCISVDWKECTGYSPAATTIFLIFLLFEALLFGIFTAIMCGTQLSAICSDETGIEQLKNSDNNTWEKKSYWLSLKTVFGHPFSYKWFSPFHETNIGKTEVYLYTV